MTPPALPVTSYFCPNGILPWAHVAWEIRDIRIDGADGTPVFEQAQVEVPTHWSERARQIVAQKYLRVVNGAKETSVHTMLKRVCSTIAHAGIDQGTFRDPETATQFTRELYHILVHQMASFNSPVWFNLGIQEKPNISACYILDVEDSLESILQWVHDEAIIFKGGSGAGVNLSKIRSSQSPLSNGGVASGPVSFMRLADAGAGAIKSGGSTRRAAKLVVLDWDHPDIHEFVWCKARAESIARDLADLGYADGLEGEVRQLIPFQNANNSVSVTDAFMERVAAERDTSYEQDLFHRIATAAWQCGDPGLFFVDTINRWHTTPSAGRIVSANPCAEFVRPPGESCNLASINLLKFLRDDATFDTKGFCHTVDILITAMDILVDHASYPTQTIAANSHTYRTLGLGYANLGALLMSMGIPYDSDEGRTQASNITSLMTARAYARSAEMAQALGPFAGFAADRDAMLGVIHEHYRATSWHDARKEWSRAQVLGESHGFRNAQVTLLAPTGTISFKMDCDTTGIEPCLDLVTEKALVGGGTLRMVNQSVGRALKALGYSPFAVHAVTRYLDTGDDTVCGHTRDDPAAYTHPSILLDKHKDVFATALGANAIAWRGHIDMVAAVQPFLSSGVSKTINMPSTATVEDIEDAYVYAWKQGLKCISIYRDGCKHVQPVVSATHHTARDEGEHGLAQTANGCVEVPVLVGPRGRQRLPATREARTHKFSLAGHEGYMTVGLYPDGKPGELFVKMAKEGSTVSGLMDTIGILTSMLFQYGVPLEVLVTKLAHMRFEPSGFTGSAEVPQASSIVDYVFRWLAHEFAPTPAVQEPVGAIDMAQFTMPRSAFVPPTDGEGRLVVYGGGGGAAPIGVYGGRGGGGGAPRHGLTILPPSAAQTDAPACIECGALMRRRAGSCYVCDICGGTSGCS